LEKVAVDDRVAVAAAVCLVRCVHSACVVTRSIGSGGGEGHWIPFLKGPQIEGRFGDVDGSLDDLFPVVGQRGCPARSSIRYGTSPVCIPVTSDSIRGTPAPHSPLS
jgi:hypothetical protein